MPIMLGSNHCYLKNMNLKELAGIRECPYDPRGYFIIKGTEKVKPTPTTPTPLIHSIGGPDARADV